MAGAVYSRESEITFIGVWGMIARKWEDLNRGSTFYSVNRSENNARFEDDDFGTVYVTAL
jgi:hypothetical protein